MKNLLFLFSLILFSACNSTAQTNSYTQLSPMQFKEMCSQKSVQLIDVRSPEEFAEGHIAGASNIDVEDKSFDERIKELNKSKPVLVYCLAGVRGVRASKTLVAAGYAQVYNLKGGLDAWEEAQLPLVK